MRRTIGLLALLTLMPGAAHAFTVTGRFLYEDRIFNGSGYTGTVQNLPIRRAKVEIVDAITTLVLASGTTDGTGAYSVQVTGQILPVSFYARCLADGRPNYQIWVVDAVERDLMGGWIPPNASVHAITTSTVIAHNPAMDHGFGDSLIQDTDGTGVAQAFNIFDCAVDFFDWMAQPNVLGRLPNTSEYVSYSWGPTNANEGSNYTLNTILLSSPGQGNDTDGWSDTVILHETGHWFDDNFSRSDNPGGAHFIGDNNANVLLAYGEGSATYHCAKVREYRALTRAVDNLVSLYADLQIPPAVGTPGGLSFSYDFETGNFGDSGVPIGQRGSANETNVTSALWDLLDGTITPDATPGADDDPVEVNDSFAWAIENTYLPDPIRAGNPMTVEDYYQGWFALNGAGFMQAGMDHIFVTLARMPFILDGFEADNSLATARTITPLAHSLAAGHVVINEIELGAADAVELYNGTPNAVDLTGWQIEVYANGTTQDPTRLYTFAPRTLNPGETVTLHEGGDPVNNGPYHVYGGDRTVFNASWNHGVDGAVVVRNSSAIAVDFARWRDAGGVNNTTPPPAGAPFAGLLDTPTPPNTLARDVHGTDTDAGADFASHYGSLGSANHPSPEAHTIYDVGDADLFEFTAAANTRYGFEARSSFSASDAKIELLDSGGAVLGGNNNIDPSVRDARLDFFTEVAGTFYLRVTHVGALTNWAEYDFLAFVRPVNNAFMPPPGVIATAQNVSNTTDPVQLQWVNASDYDSVRIYRNGTRIASLAGTPTQYADQVSRGLYKYEVSGVLAGAETPRAGDYDFAGVLSCFSADDFETGNANQWIREESQPGSRWDVTPFAQAGLFGFTDSPSGNYRGAPQGGNVNAIAEFGIPTNLPPGPAISLLEWDQICITEATFDFCIVEISNNDGTSWTELARYDQGSDPRWGDNVANPGDWRHESINISSYAGEQVIIRFRLQSDQLLELDGWYVDNVKLNSPDCGGPVSVLEPVGIPVSFAWPARPNPVRTSTVFEYAIGTDLASAGTVEVSLTLHDLQGRLIRTLRDGREGLGRFRLEWNLTDDRGRRVPPGVYYSRFRAGPLTQTAKVAVVK